MPLPYIEKKQKEFLPHTVEVNTQSLANFLPNGELYRAKNINETNFRKLLKGFAYELTAIEGKIKEVADEHYIARTINLITEWEDALGIPDECFKVKREPPDQTPIEERRKNVIAKFALMNIITRQDFIDLAAYFGYTIEIEGGALTNVFPLTFPILFSDSAKEARFTMVVKFIGIEDPNVFPYTFPITFTDDPTTFIRCIFAKLKPANVRILYEYVP